MATFKEVEVKTFQRVAMCSACDGGQYMPAGDIMLTSHPPRYPHACNACGHATHFTLRFPQLFTRPVE